MGQAIQAVAPANGAAICAAIDIGDDVEAHIGSCEVVIDFSFHKATLPVVELAHKHGKPIVIGTTGHSAGDRDAVTRIAEELPIVFAGNYSVGVNLLFYLVGRAAAILGGSYHPEIVEMHHRHKKDAPSGTAERLVEVIRAGRGLPEDSVVHGRQGISGERPDEQIGVHALRGGDVVGEHTVLFAGQGERIELTHRATDRRIFAQGALRAAHWLRGKEPGLYNMEDVLGLR